MAIKKSLVIGVAGGSGSGKTTVIREIIKELKDPDVVTLQHDAYYKDNSYLKLPEREKINYDHPDALETDLLVRHIQKLTAGEEIEMPQYDFTGHSRKRKGIVKKPARVIIVDGILIFVEKTLRDLMDVRIFVNTDNDIRFIRRLQRDMKKRGRSMTSVIKQYLSTVKPMHIAFVQPSRRYADIIIPEGHTRVSTAVVANMIKQSIADGRKLR